MKSDHLHYVLRSTERGAAEGGQPGGLTLKPLFAALGGQRLVAERLGVVQTAVSNWVVKESVPARHHLALWRMALEAGVQWEPPGAAELRPLLTPKPAEAA